MEQTNSRASRNSDSRATSKRPSRWAPSALLPEVNPEDGYAFRWIRLSTMSTDDPMNISAKLREGWEPVKASDHPEAFVAGTQDVRFPDSIQVGGLMLCKIPSEFMEQRDEYYQQQAEAQMKSVDSNFMRENDPRMPVFNERRTKVTFGQGS